MYEFATRATFGNALVFNTLHGGVGEGGQVQKLFDILGVLYIGSGASSVGTCSDKVPPPSHPERFIARHGLLHDGQEPLSWG